MTLEPLENEQPDDSDFFEGSESVMWGKRKPKMVHLQYSQMQALGRILMRSMTKHAGGQNELDTTGVPVLTLDKMAVSEASSEVTEQATAILRRPVSAYFSHFITENEESGQCRENIYIMFAPPLTYNGTVLAFHFDRQATFADQQRIEEERQNKYRDSENG